MASFEFSDTTGSAFVGATGSSSHPERMIPRARQPTSRAQICLVMWLLMLIPSMASQLSFSPAYFVRRICHSPYFNSTIRFVSLNSARRD